MMMTWRCYSCEWIQIWFLFSYVRAWWGEGGSENIRENGMKGKVELCTQTTWICFYFPSSSKLTFCLQQNKTKNVTTKQKHPQSQSWKSTERLKCSLKNQRAIRTYKERNPSSQWNESIVASSASFPFYFILFRTLPFWRLSANVRLSSRINVLCTRVCICLLGNRRIVSHLTHCLCCIQNCVAYSVWRCCLSFCTQDILRECRWPNGRLFIIRLTLPSDAGNGARFAGSVCRSV